MKDTIEVFKNFNLAEIVTMMCAMLLCIGEFNRVTLVLSAVACVHVFTTAAYRQLNDHLKKLLEEEINAKETNTTI